MPNRVLISPRQYGTLVSLHIIGSAILIIPSSLASTAKQDAWLSSLLALALALLIVPLYRALGSRIADTDMSRFAEKAFGRWAGGAFTILFIVAVPFLIASLTLRNIGDFMTTQIMPETPIQAVHILFLSIVVMGVRLGLEPIARTAEIFLPLVVCLLILLVCLIAPQIQLKNAMPILENGFLPVVRGSLSLLAFPFLEGAFLIMLLPSVAHSKEGGKALLMGILFGGCVLILVTALSILVHGTANTARQMFPSYILARKIDIGGIVDRIEIIIAIVWFITSYVRLTLLFHVTAVGLTSTLRLQDHRSLTFPLAIILLALSVIIFPNTTYNIAIVPVWVFYALLWGVLYPLLLLVFGSMRGRGRSIAGKSPE